MDTTNFNPTTASNALLDAQDLMARAAFARKTEQAAPRSIWSRFKDAVSDTPMEKSMGNANLNYMRLKNETAARVPGWILHRTNELLAQAPSELRDDLHAKRATLEAANARFQAGASFRNEVKATQESLKDAISQCESASSTEMLDMCTKNSGIALLSHIETSSAAEAVSAAKTALQRLAKRMQAANGVHQDLKDGPDDLLDLLLDPGIDFLSWMNMSALDESADSCQKALDKLSPLRAQVDRIHNKLDVRLQASRQEVDAIEAPFRTQAFQEMPGNLRDLCPHLAPPSSPGIKRRPGMR